MAKESIVQIRMDSSVKEAVETLYRNLGTSFAEAVRVFAAQSISENGYPFVPRLYKKNMISTRGRLEAYASELLRKQEEDAFMKAMVQRHEYDSRR